MRNITIVKVGGAVVEDEARLEALLDDFAALEGPKMLVHGGGRRATKVAEALGVESRMVNGRRVTGKDMLDVVTMVYGGLINKDIVARLQARGVNAAGLSGADMDVIRSVRRPVTDGVDFGFVGDVRHVGADRLKMLIDAGITPVLAPLTHDGHGSMLNTNADTIASSAATSLVEYYDVTLVFCFEKKGGGNKTSVCTVFEAGWKSYTPTHVEVLGYPAADGDYMVFTVRADRFLRNMVRAMVGSLINVGRGKKEPQWIKSLIENGSRSDAGESVPGHALFLRSISY